MRAHWVILVLVALAALSVPALADTVTCGTFGQTCATDGTIVAGTTGEITGNLYYASANFTSYVRVIDTNPNNRWVSPWMLNNQTTPIGGPSVDFGSAMKGDILVVQLCDQNENFATCGNGIKNPYVFSNDPVYSADNLSHAQIAENGGACATASCESGIRTQLIWLEDLSNKQHSDWDYNDLVLALHNIDVTFPNGGGLDASPVPEPATITMLAGGLAAGLFRRMKKS